MHHKIRPSDIPTTLRAYLDLDAPTLRLLRPKGDCHLLGKVIGETERSYRVVFPIGERLHQKWVRKGDTVHLTPCRYCPDA
jgi:hypothetical protein